MPIVDEFGDPDATPRARIFTRIAHLLPYVLTVYLVASVLDWIFTLSPVWRFLVFIPCYVVVLSSSLHISLARLCLTCMQQVPADAAARADRYRMLLRVSHMIWIPVVLCVVLPLIAHGSDALLFRIPDSIMFIGYMVGGYVHHRYRPWCPYCRRWDGGGGMHECTPDPVASGVRTRT